MSSELSDGISTNSRERTIYSLLGDDSWGFCLNLWKYWAYSSSGWKWGFVGICTKTVHVQLWVEKWGFCLYLCKICISSFGLKVRSLFGFVQQLQAFLLWAESYNLLKFVQKLWNCECSSLGWKLAFVQKLWIFLFGLKGTISLDFVQNLCMFFFRLKSRICLGFTYVWYSFHIRKLFGC